MSELIQSETANGFASFPLPISSLDHEFGYDVDGNLITDTVTYEGRLNQAPNYPMADGVVYVQTFTYEDGNLVQQTGWVPQEAE
jgi:hypothetical protein